jgi:ribosomal protein L11 methyltransferase
VLFRKQLFYLSWIKLMQLNERYTLYTIEVSNPDIRDVLVAELSQLGIDAFEEQEDKLIATGLSDQVNKAEVAELLKSFTLTFQSDEIKNENWNAQWESSFEPVLVDDFAGIRASFHKPLDVVRHEIVITPKMSFGTGHHATTWLVMKGMSAIDFGGKDVLDFGTGTGVLAILADRLGAASVHAIDNDEWSIENAKENLADNGCKVVSLALADTIPAGAQYDIILANINKHILLANGKALADAIKAGGLWVLSGLLEADEMEMLAMATSFDMDHLHTERRNGWIAIHFRSRVNIC